MPTFQKVLEEARAGESDKKCGQGKEREPQTKACTDMHSCHIHTHLLFHAFPIFLLVLTEVELQMGRIRVALEDRLRSPELSVDEAVNSCLTELPLRFQEAPPPLRAVVW